MVVWSYTGAFAGSAVPTHPSVKSWSLSELQMSLGAILADTAATSSKATTAVFIFSRDLAG